MKILKQLLLAAALAAPFSGQAGVTRDPNGWTQITPSADSRIVYVSSSSGSDANDGLSAATAKATIAAGDALIRSGFPDHLLLKRGDTFTMASGGLGAWKSGRSATEPVLFSYYGTSGARPVVKITNDFINHNGAVRNFQLFKGVEVYKSNSDPASADFTNVECHHSLRFVGGGQNLRIEDCRLRFLEITIQSYGGGVYSNVEVRRNIVTDAWKHNSFTAKVVISGMFLSGAVGYLIEENFFDHNGWNETVANAGANQFNHNIYVQYSNSEGGIMRGNILAQAAAHGLQARSGGEVDRNLFVKNAIGFNVGGLEYPTDPDVQPWPNFAHDNVVLNGRLMSTVNSAYPRTSAVWGVWEDIFVTGAHIDGNIVANRLDSGGNVAYNGKANMDFGTNISYNWDPAQDATNPAWPHPGDDLGDYNAAIGGTNSTTAYLTSQRNRALGDLPWNMTAYAAINYIRAGFLMSPVQGPYAYPGQNGPVVTIAATDASAGEPSDGGSFTVTATPAPTAPLTVNLALSGTATNGTDYASIAATVIVPTSGSVAVPVTVTNDAAIEGSETVTLTVASGAGYTVGGASAATVTITDNDPEGTVATAGGGFVNTALAASQTGLFAATFTATPSGSLVDAVVGLAHAAPAAYTDVATIVRFNNTGTIDARNGGAYAAASSIPYSGGSTYQFRLVINVVTHLYSIYVTPPGGSELTVGTNYAFRTEQAAVASLNYWTAQVATPTGSSVTVNNFSLSAVTPVVTIAATDASAGEPSNHGMFTLTASPAPAAPLTVNLSRTGTATNGSDYNSIATTVSVGTSGTATIPVTVINDIAVEGSETVILTVISGTGYAVGSPSSATVTITSEDVANLLSHGNFEPDQATVLQDMPNQFILGTHASNIWQGRVGAVSSQNTTYQTSGTNHFIAVGGSANGPGTFQVVTWPGTGTRTLTFQYRGSLAVAKIYGGNTGATIEKFSGSNTLTLLQTITKSSVSAWTSATHTITLTGSYNYLVIQLKGGDFDDLSIAP